MHAFFVKNLDTIRQNVNFIVMISEIILKDDGVWWIDPSFTRYLCKDKNLFKKYELMEDRSILYIESLSTTHIKG